LTTTSPTTESDTPLTQRALEPLRLLAFSGILDSMSRKAVVNHYVQSVALDVDAMYAVADALFNAYSAADLLEVVDWEDRDRGHTKGLLIVQDATWLLVTVETGPERPSDERALTEVTRLGTIADVIVTQVDRWDGSTGFAPQARPDRMILRHLRFPAPLTLRLPRERSGELSELVLRLTRAPAF
jgi:hypothetical protein